MRKDQGGFNKNVMIKVRRDGSLQNDIPNWPFTGEVMSEFISICSLWTEA